METIIACEPHFKDQVVVRLGIRRDGSNVLAFGYVSDAELPSQIAVLLDNGQIVVVGKNNLEVVRPAKM